MTDSKKDDTLDLDDIFMDLEFDTDGSGPKIDLQPFVDADDEITVETCMHVNKKWVVQGVNLKYWYCPACKKEVKNCPPPKKERKDEEIF